MSPKGKTLLGILGVLIGTVVSFLLAAPMVKSRPDFQGESEGAPVPPSAPPASAAGFISKIVFACDAGMGSSALGATRFKARLMKAGLQDIKCTNCAVGDIPADASLVVCQRELAERAALSGKEVLAITNFLSDPALDALLDRLSVQGSGASESGGSGLSAGCINPNLSASCGETDAEQEAPLDEPLPLLAEGNVLTGLAGESKEEAILRAGRMLEAAGYVDEGYADAMLERERVATTYMGSGVAIPHGTAEAKAKVRKSGIVVLQYPEGVDFGDEKARLVIGIAGVGDDHLEILAKLATALEDPDTLNILFTSPNSRKVYETLMK